MPQFSRGLHVSSSRNLLRPEAGPSESRSTRHARRERRGLVVGIAGSIFLHALLGLVVRSTSVFLDAAAPGAEQMLVADRIQVVFLIPTATDPPPWSETTPDQVGTRPRALDLDQVEVRRTAAELPRAEPAELVGTAQVPSFTFNSQGPGKTASPTSGAAEGESTLAIPRARFILGDWRVPAALLGREVLVRAQADPRGRATGLVQLVPPTGDDDADRELIHRARTLEYWPALRDGKPVTSWAEISIRFCHDGITAASPPSPAIGSGEVCAPARGEARPDSAKAERRAAQRMVLSISTPGLGATSSTACRV